MSQAKCRIGVVGEAGVAAVEIGPGGDRAPEILSYLEVVGDRAELQDGRRFSPDVFRVGDGAAGRDDERSAGIAEPSLLNPGCHFAIVLHGLEGGRRARRSAGSGSSGKRVPPRRRLARTAI